MTKKVKSILLGLFISILAVLPTFAATINGEVESEVIVQNDNRVVVQLYDRRGNWIADAILEINNPRNGKIGIYMETQCHMAVDEIIMNVAVDKQVGSNSWQQVDYLSYTFTAKKNQELTDASVDLQLTGQEANAVYKLRGVHAAILNGSTETLTSATPGLLITDH